ncbi:flagellar hook-basal body complex protein FliE [Clostridium chauvoei]|uniref:Flagellar hook-basal body complex protein FliE n=2 Tax=Clostridium chauvoei TaxID=46867 RepID=S6EPQ9_9CLOT|nr:flagellar hook-basal body complex protein FliE [Clostridium chauvoei]ATD54632.1 flagellar hook-basal body complex protein FliE [Clostridium chauvoei]ATD57686.1 flagellar hook-basal body complex protein FliE [Clostridium chauvoei]MBX7279925.1 flagellar hook-basal body complex protein FliE [Clostridium chauvoei]MBX7282416.1 flagellar hook-basal body complex protein FliE [Clostridium chauvoei]MBX7284816.1 flagellar hook-basal body complex protein FliE [Clostridium chauvoei]
MRINSFIPNSSDLEIAKPNIKNKENDKFSSMLKESLDKLNEKQVVADDLTNQFVAGEKVDIHKIMLATEESKMSLQLAVQVRNKVVEAIQELTRTQL